MHLFPKTAYKALCCGAAIFMGLALVACTPDDKGANDQSGAKETTAAQPDNTHDDACGAAKLQAMVGKNTSDLSAEVTATARILGPNDPMTRDFRLDRLNIFHDGAQKIVKINCG